MAKKKAEIATGAADSFQMTEIIEANPYFTRRQMLGITGLAGITALTAFQTQLLGRQLRQGPASPFWPAIGLLQDRMPTGL
jgi:hypothetical protein